MNNQSFGETPKEYLSQIEDKHDLFQTSLINNKNEIDNNPFFLNFQQSALLCYRWKVKRYLYLKPAWR